MKDFTILTATLESLGRGDNYPNSVRNSALCAKLNSRGYNFESATGYYNGVFQGESFIIHHLPLADALALAKRFGQESIITDAGLVFVTRAVVPSLGIIYGEQARETGNYTRTSKGLCFSLVLQPDDLLQATARYQASAPEVERRAKI